MLLSRLLLWVLISNHVLLPSKISTHYSYLVYVMQISDQKKLCFKFREEMNSVTAS
jgi:hypothetical protein